MKTFINSTALTRRSFIKSATVFGVATAAGYRCPLMAQQIPSRIFQASEPMQIGLNAYSFAKMLNAVALKRKGPGMTLFELLDYCAHPDHRFDAVDITGYYFPNYSSKEATTPPDNFVDNIRRRAADLGLPISGTGIGNSLTGVPFDRKGKEGIVFSKDEGGDRELIEKDIERIKVWTEVAARLGAPVIRVFTGLEPSYLMAEHIKPNDPAREEKAKKLKQWRAEKMKWMVDDLKELAEHGKKMGVIIGIQNHGDFLKTADETVELIQAVDSKWIGVIVDTGYFLTPDPYQDIESVMPFAVNFQIKEFVRATVSPYQMSMFKPTDLNRLMGIIRHSGYRGYLPIETLSAGKTTDYEPLKEVPVFLKSVRESVAAIG
ncbi:MAG: sugar phosphate isomerase/epimerase [Verrucomicrobia bacterium]|nr:sugar phosphate isomerase/epimerase [Verrucomicrobiota bacterium]MDA1066859.1 sugar phosphate isomerase/epimerase [Verrucomicrobiota bacterium]